MQAQEERDALESGPHRTDADDLNYTAVTKESFSTWCAAFLAQLRKQEEAQMTEQDARLTGRQWFIEHEDAELGQLTLDEGIKLNHNTATNYGATKFEEEKYEEGPDSEDESAGGAESGALYDKDLFAQELGDLVDEDVDFD